MFEFWVSPCHISVKRVFPACSRAVPATFSSLLRQKLSSSSLHFCYQPGAVVLLVTITSMAKHTHSRVLGLLTNADSNKSFKNSFLCLFLSSGDAVGALQKKVRRSASRAWCHLLTILHLTFWVFSTYSIRSCLHPSICGKIFKSDSGRDHLRYCWKKEKKIWMYLISLGASEFQPSMFDICKLTNSSSVSAQ